VATTDNVSSENGGEHDVTQRQESAVLKVIDQLRIQRAAAEYG